jgi:hypothetical protein
MIPFRAWELSSNWRNQVVCFIPGLHFADFEHVGKITLDRSFNGL